MSKPKSTQAYMERLQAQIAKDIEGKNFKTIEEINAYIQEKYLNKEVEFDTTNLTPKEKAMDLVYEAMDSDNKKKIITLAEKALKLDEDCADAYNLLARHKAKTSEEILEFYAKGIEAGKRSLGSDFDKMKGKFWGFHETRPFMRAMAGYADILWHLKERSKSVEVMKEMLLLNPDDNQGIRHTLITRLLILNRFLEADKLYEDYRDDYSAQWYYSKAYLYFNKRSKQLYADKVLKEAMEFNPYVPLYLFQIEEMPDELPDYVSPGDENEAIVYAAESFELWAENEKTLRWFIRTFKKMQDKLERLIEQRDKEMEERFGRFNR